MQITITVNKKSVIISRASEADNIVEKMIDSSETKSFIALVDVIERTIKNEVTENE